MLDKAIAITNKGKTEIITEAPELYIRDLNANRSATAAIKYFNEKVHPFINPKYIGKSPSKEEQEEILGM